MSPGDAAVAARSFPRRWRALFATVAGDDDPGDVLRRHGASSPSALALGQRAAEVLAVTAERLARVRRETDPALSGDPPPATPGEPEEVLDAIDAAAVDVATTIESTDAGDWRRPASLGGEATDALGVVTAGIDAAAALLRDAQKVLEEVRR
jgi:hypothetical protein